MHSGARHDTLFVLVHGFRGGERSWSSLLPALLPFGDVLVIEYPAHIFSNAKPELVARGISAEIEDSTRQRPYANVTLIGHSIGAPIVRKAFLHAVGGVDDSKDDSPTDWGARVKRIVLLAGMNRGWDISGQKPSDMGWVSLLKYWSGAWFGRLTGSGQLILSMETGSPFIANLRLEWIRWFRRPDTPEVVQLLGDIDDVVSDEDNKDLRAAASKRFVWLKVRGTGHLDILDFTDAATGIGADGTSLGDYRRAKILLAIRAPFDEVQAENEEQPFQTDPEVTHIVFVLHGIRDLGRWSAHFERALLAEFRRLRGEGRGKLVVESIRYGYFGMGPFLLRTDRQKHVRWFMDKYTETLARYPNAGEIDFFGHSNGTYLLASALTRYSSLKVNRVVFAGSVVPTRYDWSTVVSRGQVQAVRNYVAADDYVVALFPRLFELPPLQLFGNDIGSAGFNGFSVVRNPAGQLPIENVGFITGHHSAFRKHLAPIVRFLLASGDLPPQSEAPQRRGSWTALKVFSDWGCWAVWLALFLLVLWIGVSVTSAADRLAWPVVLAYSALILVLLSLV